MPQKTTHFTDAMLFFQKSILLLLILIMSSDAFAQTSIQVHGTVVDEKNVPVQDATI